MENLIYREKSIYEIRESIGKKWGYSEPISQDEFARELNVSVELIKKWESGTVPRSHRFSQLLMFCNYYEIDVPEFFVEDSLEVKV